MTWLRASVWLALLVVSLGGYNVALILALRLVCWRLGHDLAPAGPFDPLRRRCRRCARWCP